MLKKKEITIDDLALMVHKGFNDVSDKLEETTKKKDLEKLEKRFNTLDVKMDNMNHKINQIDRRLFSIEEDIVDIKVKQYGNLVKRINFIERKLGIANAN